MFVCPNCQQDDQLFEIVRLVHRNQVSFATGPDGDVIARAIPDGETMLISGERFGFECGHCGHEFAQPAQLPAV